MIIENLSELIVFENKEFIIVNKPAGISYHKDRNDSGFFSGVEDYLGQKIFSIHRLDKGTSGAILFAKDKLSQKEFMRMFASREVTKIYYAVSLNKPKKKQGIVKGDIIPNRGGGFRLTRGQVNPSLTRFKSYRLQERTLLRLMPITGQTHQLRVVCRSLGAPILGDTLYGGEVSDRPWLHATSVSFSLFGKDYSFLCPPQGGEFERFESFFNTH